MALTFYYGSGSPFAWRVWLALEHKQVPYELKVLSFSGDDLRSPEFTAVNPRRKVPAIVDDGFGLYESNAIVEYLEEKFAAGPSLLPSGIQDRARVRRIVEEADWYVNTAMRPLAEEIFFKSREQWDLARIDDAAKKFAEELKIWESYEIGDFLVGGALSAADITLYPVMALALRLEKRKSDLGIRYMIGPKLASWMRYMSELPIVHKTWPPHWK